MSLTIADLEQVQAEHPDWQMELVNGKIIITGPANIQSNQLCTELASQLRNWIKPRKLGRVFESSSCFVLPGTDLRAPAISLVIEEGLRRCPPSCSDLVPDLVVEVQAQANQNQSLHKKMQQFLELGVQIGLLLNPGKRTVTVYRPTGEPIVFEDGDILTLPDLLPGWELTVSNLWPTDLEPDLWAPVGE
ncbi:Uma2 family endonuclease [Leptolyngbya sp. FACHB-261]|uniref:Uma2 family endonuclease n=1 Tax=Leptolyngbya sp. FACHB-261 TaxID=2692806 RepID=UPI00168223DC|nr:Uma2 family endonuclease [Leptolyngbya sp. FACHB-261]MBD2100771.1 Uma2 family endonuclease [Leptolyngbya sp. FACHB-261]